MICKVGQVSNVQLQPSLTSPKWILLTWWKLNMHRNVYRIGAESSKQSSRLGRIFYHNTNYLHRNLTARDNWKYFVYLSTKHHGENTFPAAVIGKAEGDKRRKQLLPQSVTACTGAALPPSTKPANKMQLTIAHFFWYHIPQPRNTKGILPSPSPPSHRNYTPGWVLDCWPATTTEEGTQFDSVSVFCRYFNLMVF